jgi:hypothetical protein
MAHTRLGHRAEAERLLDRYRRSFAHPPTPSNLVQIEDILFREAEELIEAGGAAKK